MKAIILAGGLGTRLGNETKLKPKPMIKIGKLPMIVHIMQIYSKFKINEFIIAGGYKYNFIKDYFNKKKFKKFDIKIINTGTNSMTGGRIYKLRKFIDSPSFMVTYGDGLANVNIQKLLKFHKNNKKLGTMTIVRPPARWGHVTLKKNLVLKFEEKNQLNEGWINGGFFVFEKEIFNLFKKFKNKNAIILETDILPLLSKKRGLSAFKHNNFWKCMDTPRDKREFNKFLKNKKLPWMKF
jgi:glucose-1-phosphate cytidylyltransferase